MRKLSFTRPPRCAGEYGGACRIGSPSIDSTALYRVSGLQIEDHGHRHVVGARVSPGPFVDHEVAHAREPGAAQIEEIHALGTEAGVEVALRRPGRRRKR